MKKAKLFLLMGIVLIGLAFSTTGFDRSVSERVGKEVNLHRSAYRQALLVPYESSTKQMYVDQLAKNAYDAMDRNSIVNTKFVNYDYETFKKEVDPDAAQALSKGYNITIGFAKDEQRIYENIDQDFESYKGTHATSLPKVESIVSSVYRGGKGLAYVIITF